MSTKTFVVTGASSGLGEALAKAYAARKDNVIVAARSSAEIERVASECERLGGRALAVETDVTESSASVSSSARSIGATASSS
ncbi:MAG: SDR family NAD(P)-dependent oxidoreductase [Polyangiaceae bacterium]